MGVVATGGCATPFCMRVGERSGHAAPIRKTVCADAFTIFAASNRDCRLLAAGVLDERNGPDLRGGYGVGVALVFSVGDDCSRRTVGDSVRSFGCLSGGLSLVTRVRSRLGLPEGE